MPVQSSQKVRVKTKEEIRRLNPPNLRQSVRIKIQKLTHNKTICLLVFISISILEMKIKLTTWFFFQKNALKNNVGWSTISHSSFYLLRLSLEPLIAGLWAFPSTDWAIRADMKIELVQHLNLAYKARCNTIFLEVLWFCSKCSGFRLLLISNQYRQILSENANLVARLPPDR